MSSEQFPYADIVEVRNLGRRKANVLLDKGWVLLDWRIEDTIMQRSVPDAAGDPQPMYFKIQTIQYILGRENTTEFTGDDLNEWERQQDREKREARREADEHRVSERLPEGVEENVREAVANPFGSPPTPDAPLSGTVELPDRREHGEPFLHGPAVDAQSGGAPE